MNWQPLILSPHAGTYKTKLEEIAVQLKESIDQIDNSECIYEDVPAAILFLFYYSRFSRDEIYADKAMDLVSKAFDYINTAMAEGDFNHSANAMAGMGWLLEHLDQKGFLEKDEDDLMANVDPLLHQVMMFDMKKRRYDQVSGAIHKGIYFLSRLEKNDTKQYLEDLADHLVGLSHKETDGSITFRVDFADQTREHKFFTDLGLAHGIPGVSWFLAKMLEADIAVKKVTPLLDGFVSYILNHMQDTSQYSSNFPKLVIGEGTPAKSRMAWCYGDPGVAVALWQAGKSRGNNEWQEAACRIMRHAATRRELKENSVVDAGLCHGTAGLTLMFNRMFQYTGEKIFAEAATYWLDQTLKMANFPDGNAGFKCLRGDADGKTGFLNTINLLEGTPGIGLAIISAISDIEPTWDRIIYLS